MKVYGSPLSPYVRKVFLALQLKDLGFEQQDMIPGAIPPEYYKISPLGKIPAFEDGDLTLCDSTVICEYLEEQYPEVPLRPNNPADRGHARWLEEYADTKLMELCGGGIFLQRFVKPLLMQQESDEGIVRDTIENKLPPVLDYLESQSPQSGFMFAQDIGLTDISVLSPFVNAAYAEFTVDAEKWPILSAYLERIKHHPIVSAQIDSEKRFLALLGK